MFGNTHNKNTIIFVEPPAFNITLPDNFIEKYSYHKILLIDLHQEHNFNNEFYNEIITCDLRTSQGIKDVYKKIPTKLNICAIIGFSENSVIPTAILAELFCVQGIGLEIAQKCRNKFLMAESLHSNGVKAPEYFITETSTGISEKISRIGGYPVICKPLMGYASNNVIKANNDKELEKAIHKIKISNKFVMSSLYEFEESNYISTVIVQEYIKGNEVAVDGYIDNQEVNILSIIDKPDVSSGPYFPDKTHILPSKLEEGILLKIKNEVIKCIDALNLNNSPFHIEARIRNGSIYIIELGARVGFPSCLYYASGINIFTLILDQKLERPFDHTNKWNRYSGSFCISSQKLGRFVSLNNVDLIRKDSSIIDIPIFATKGQRVAPYPDSNSYIGFVLACSNSYDDVLNALYQAKDMLEVKVD